MIITDDEVEEVHGSSNFGKMAPRMVLDEAVLKTAYGYHSGSTAKAILKAHKLVRSDGFLTAKGIAYLRSLNLYEVARDKLERDEG